ncbi:MAG: trigger factor [Pseudomonadota bacterium]
MDVTEVSNEGLERKFKVTVSATELDEKLTAKIEGMKDEIHLKGFRKGKAPVPFLKKMYGKGFMSEIVQQLVEETATKAFTDRDLQPATPPNPEFHSDMDAVMAGKADLEYDVHAEILPSFEPASLEDLTLTRPVAEVPDADLNEALDAIAKQQRSYSAKDDAAAAANDDMVVIDFEGKIGGTAFEGGKGENTELVLGSGSFIPGFEEQLLGTKKGDELDVNVTFPDDYGHEPLAGKDAVFAVHVHEIKGADAVAIDDALADKVGLKDLAELKDKVRERIESDYANLSRAHVKRALLDRLDEAHDFDLPKSMVDAEFNQIWSQVENAERDEEDKDKSEDELKTDYRKIAERRVRLGLVLAEIGKKANVDVPSEDVQREIIRTAQQFPGQEREVLEFYRSNPQAMAQLRAPLFEERVVDHIIENAAVTDKTVSKEDLMKDPDGEDL